MECNRLCWPNDNYRKKRGAVRIVFKTLRRHFRDHFVIFFIFVLVTCFYFPLLQNITRGIPSLDWYGIYPFASFFRISILEYHQFPLRAPHFAGGYPMIGHPYDISLNPLSIIVLLFGAIEGIKITIFLIFLISALSMFYLTRYLLGYNLLGSFFSSATFILSSWGSCQYLESNYEKLYFYFLPLIFVCFIKCKENKKFIFFSCLALSMIVLCGGAILIPVILFLFLFACINTVQIEKGPKIKIKSYYLSIFLLILLITFFLCMAKILPMLQLLVRENIEFIHFPYEHSYSAISKTIIDRGRALNLIRLYELLFIKDSYIIEGDDYLQIYFGYIPVILAGLSFMFYWRKTFGYLILLIVFIVLSFGPNSPLDLFKYLWRLHPFIHGIWRLDEFFTFPILFIISLVSGRFFHLLEGGNRRKLLWFLIPIVIFSLNNMFWSNRRFLKNQIVEEKAHLEFQEGFYHVKIKDRLADEEDYQRDGYFYLQQDIGMTNWLFTNLEIKTGVIPKYLIDPGDYKYISESSDKIELNPRYRAEAFFLDQRNKAKLQYFSPNKIHVIAGVEKVGTLIINQNYHKGWRTNIGRLFNHRGLLAIALDKTGRYTVRLNYVPLDFYLGLIVSLISLALSYYFFVYKKCSRLRRI